MASRENSLYDVFEEVDTNLAYFAGLLEMVNDATSSFSSYIVGGLSQYSEKQIREYLRLIARTSQSIVQKL